MTKLLSNACCMSHTYGHLVGRPRPRSSSKSTASAAFVQPRCGGVVKVCCARVGRAAV